MPAEQILTASARFSVRNADNTSDVSYTDYSINDDVLRQIDREDNSDGRNNDYDFRLEYENRFEGDRHRLTADVNFGFGREKEQSHLIQILNQFNGEADGGIDEPLQDQRTDNQERYSDFRFRSDYERPIGNGSRFEAGIRSSMDRMRNDYTVEEYLEESWVTIPSYHDNFNYREMIHAAYGIFSGKLEPLSWQFGLRAEQTGIDTELAQSGETGRQSYFNLFPSMSLTWQISEFRSIQTNYSRRLSRPRSRWILPFSGYADSRNIFRGNPDLEPEFSHSFETGYLRHWESGSAMPSVYYRYRTGVIERITSQEENFSGDPVTVRYPINLATEEAWGVELTADQEVFNNFQLSGSLNYARSESAGMYQGEELTSSTGSLQSRIRVRWRFLDSWNFYSFLRYRGPRTTTQGRTSAMSFMNTGLAKQMFDRSLTVSLDVRDLLNTRQRDRIIDEPDFYSERRNTWSSRSIRMNIRYRF